MKSAYIVLWSVILLAFLISAAISLPAPAAAASSLSARPSNSESHHLARLARLVSPYLQRLQQQQQEQQLQQVNHRTRTPSSLSKLSSNMADQDVVRNNLNVNSGDDDVDDFEDPDWMDFHDNPKRQYDDYGHLRFGKRADFDDYGHMRFGRSTKST